MRASVIRGIVVLVFGLTLTGCSFALPGAGGGANASSVSAVSEREHQDAQVLANVVRADLARVESMGVSCENVDAVAQCADSVAKAQADIDHTVGDVAQLRIPAYMKADTDALLAALARAAKACGPVLSSAGNRIAEAYAANEFDTSIRHVMTTFSKLNQDAN